MRLLALLIVMLSASAFAAPVVYRLDIDITSATIDIVPEGSLNYPCDLVDCSSPIGRHTGFFALDSSVLEHEGLLATVPLFFYFEINGTVRDSQNPARFPQPGTSQFAGYRYSCSIPIVFDCTHGGWTVDVHNGELKGICCGVFGAGDFPLMDTF